MLAAVEAGCDVVEYTPAEVKRAVVGYGRAEKQQVQQMIKLLLGLDQAPSPHDAADALAVAICHLHSMRRARRFEGSASRRRGRTRVDSDPGSATDQRRIARSPGASTVLAARRMIAFLRGRVLDKQPNRIIVDVQGVGYEVHVPLSTYYDVGEEGAEVSLRVYTHVREDALQLYGFLTDLERQLFERLIGISGIGPKLAIAVLSGMDTRDWSPRCSARDVARLTAIPGIGKKTAERIVLELKDRLDAARGRRSSAGAATGAVGSRPAARRPALGAPEPRLSSAAGRESDRRRAEDRR